MRNKGFLKIIAYVSWSYLGRYVWVVISSCVVLWKCQEYPDLDGLLASIAPGL